MEYVFIIIEYNIKNSSKFMQAIYVGTFSHNMLEIYLKKK